MRARDGIAYLNTITQDAADWYAQKYAMKERTNFVVQKRTYRGNGCTTETVSTFIYRKLMHEHQAYKAGE